MNVCIVSNTYLDLLLPPASIFRRALIDGASELDFNGDLLAHYDPSVESASSPLTRSDNCEAMLKPHHRSAMGCWSAACCWHAQTSKRGGLVDAARTVAMDIAKVLTHIV